MPTDLAEPLNRALEETAPAVFAALSPLGRRAAFPPDIPFQAAQARGKAFNATIGQITDGRGGAVLLPPMAAALGSLDATDRDRAFLYSPVEGIAELRERWRAWQRRGQPEGKASSLPLVTAGLTHGLSLVADLFGGEGRTVVVPAPFWGNYRQSFALRTGARVVAVPAHTAEGFRPEAIEEELSAAPAGEPAVAVLNFPSNPGGYSPTREERARLAASLARAAAHRPIVALCDDAYAGLVYDDAVPRGSIFWDLVGLDPGLIPVKVDGATKEFSFFGGRVGFVTFAFAPESQAAGALESKVKCLVRAAIGSPVATSQVVLLEALRREGIAAQVEEVRRMLAARYRALMAALAETDPAILRPLPCNSGCFALVELREALGLSSEEVRLHLLATEDAGLVAFPPRFLRIAFCSVAEEALPELVLRLERGVRALAERR